MHGLVLDAPRTVSHRRDLDEPSLEGPRDAIVEVRRAGLCGSDLHPYEGRESVRFGVTPGHEVVGDVVEVGTAVRRLERGQRVVVPFTTSCGRCWACDADLSARCVEGRLFGFGSPDGTTPPLQGGQAERLRVPLADATVVPVPRSLTDEAALLLSDNLPTGWYAVERADTASGLPMAVIGLGAVGLCAVAAARVRGADPVIGIDPIADRRARAADLGAVTAAPDEAEEVTSGRRIHSAVEAAGTMEAQRLAASLVAPGGTLAVIAVQTADRFGPSPVEAYDRNLTMRFGRAPVRSLLERLLPRVLAGQVPPPTAHVLTHPAVPLTEGPEIYRRFAAREAGLVKAAFVP